MIEVRVPGQSCRTRTAHGTTHGNYPLPCPLCSPPRPLCALGAVLAQSLPCLSRPSLSLLRLSGLRSPPKCPTSFAPSVPSSLVLVGPRCTTLRRHAAPLPSGQREHDAEQFARQRSLSALPLWPGPLALSCPMSARPLSPCPAPRRRLLGLWPPVSLSPSSPYPLGVHRAEQCARQPSHSLSSLPPPGALTCCTHFVPNTIPPGAGCLAAAAPCHVQSPRSLLVASSVTGHPRRSCPWSAHSSRGIHCA